MANAVSEFIKQQAFNNSGRGQKVAAMPSSEVQEYMATHISREYLEEMERERNK